MVMNESNRIKSILKNSQAIIFYWKAEDNWPVEYVSENVSLFGYDAESFISGKLSYSSIVHPKDLIRVGEEVETYTQLRRDAFRQVYRLIDSQGKTRWIDDRTIIERDDKGNPIYYVGTIIDITEQKKAEEYNALLGNVLNESTDEVYVFERGLLRFTYLNLAALKNIGFTMEEARELTPFDIKSDLNEIEFTNLLASLLEPKHSSSFNDSSQLQTVCFETQMRRKDGSTYPAEARVQTMEVDGRLQFVAMIRDVSQQKALQYQKEEDHRFIQSVIDSVADSIMVIDKDYNITTMNQAAQKKLDLQFVKNTEQPKCYEVSHHRDTPCEGDNHPCPLKMVFNSKKTVTVIHNHGHDGVNSFVELTAKPLIDKDGRFNSIVESSHDITKLIEAQEELIHQTAIMSYDATHDGLTGLANRRLFDDRIEQALFRSKRHTAQMAVALIDVDKFKYINDTYGHLAGDEVLVEVAKRLKANLRNTDTVARLGGDEFVILLESLKSDDCVDLIMSKVIDAFQTPITVADGKDIAVSISVGVSIYEHEDIQASDIIKQADIALYQVKEAGRNGYKIFGSQ